MRLRKFDNVESVVRDYGNEEANEELRWLLKLARTNFAACYGTGTQGPDAHDSAIDRLYARVPAIEGGGRRAHLADLRLDVRAGEGEVHMLCPVGHHRMRPHGRDRR